MDAGNESPSPLVLTGSSEAVARRLADPASLLSAAERGRAAALRSGQDRSDFIAAHVLVRVAAGLLLATPAGELTLIQCCDSCGGDHGRPSIAGAAGIHVSMSHTRGVVAAAAGFGPVAVDVERVTGRAVDPGMAKLALHPAERLLVAGATDADLAFLRFWVRKESLVKLGRLTLDSLTDVDLSALPPEEDWLGSTTRQLTWERWQLVEWSHPATQVVGCAIGPMPPRMVEWR